MAPMRQLALIALLLASASASAAQVYRWTDAAGKVHYGDRPVAGAESLDVRPASGDGGAAGELAADSAARAAACEQEKRNLGQLRSSAGIRLIDKEYKVRDYTPSERDQYIARSEKRVAELCGGPAI